MVFQAANTLAAAAAARVGRHLLNHCFTVTGGSNQHQHLVADGGTSNATVAVAGADAWSGVDADIGVHADRYSVRLIYWLVHTLAALALLILMLTWWPPSERVFPRKKPVARLVPWCLVGRMLGYGVIDWREGKLTPFLRYFRERHELLSLWMGDMQFITFRARLTHFAASMICAASLSMVGIESKSTMKAKFESI